MASDEVKKSSNKKKQQQSPPLDGKFLVTYFGPQVAWTGVPHGSPNRYFFNRNEQVLVEGDPEAISFFMKRKYFRVEAFSNG